MALAKHMNNICVSKELLNQHDVVIFGLAGSLVDSGRKCSINAFKTAFNAIGITSVTEHDIRQHIGIDIREHVKKLFASSHVYAEYANIYNRTPYELLYNDIADEINITILNSVNGSSKANPGAPLLTQKLYDQGVKIGVTTEYNMNITDKIINNLKAQGVHIDAYVTSDEVRIGKPEPWQARMLMKKLGVNHLDTNGIKIGDTIMDVIEGNKLGFTTCIITNRPNLPEFNRDNIMHLSESCIGNGCNEVRKLPDTYKCDMYVDNIEELEKKWFSNY